MNSQTFAYRKTARILSLMLHPFFIAPLTYSLILFHRAGVSLHTVISFILGILGTVILPAIYIFGMKKRHLISSVDIPDRTKRTNPFLFGTLIYLITGGLLWLIKAPAAVVILMLVYAINTLIATGITKYWKISIHGMGTGGPIAALGYFISPGFYWSLLFLPVLIFARVIPKYHTPSQVLAGFIGAFVITLIQLKLYIPL